jgi:hypothetical protein
MCSSPTHSSTEKTKAPRLRRCGAVRRDLVRLAGDLEAACAQAGNWLEKAVLAALVGSPCGRTHRAIARAVGRVTVDDVACAVIVLRDLGAVADGICDRTEARPQGRSANGRCRLHGGASTGARTEEGRAKLAAAGRRGGLARWYPGTIAKGEAA